MSTDNTGKLITIVGGGLAGLSLGISLRQRNIPVTLIEAGKYPRHRVCGEFISGLGQCCLERSGLSEKLLSAGARFAQTASFFSGEKSSGQKNLAEPALCLSRFSLDHLVAKEFVKLGGELHSGTRWTEKFGEGVVRATGRRVRNAVAGWRYFGLKVHARNVSLTSDLEMHFVPNGYVGLCQLSDGEINICGLFRSRTAHPDLATNWRDWLVGSGDSALADRLAAAKFDKTSFCSVAGLLLEPRSAAASSECCIGDSLTMIPPVTGNGMSMAFESAELAVEPIADYSAGKISWSEAQQIIGQRCDKVFQTRLKWAGLFQIALFVPVLRTSFLLAARIPGIWPKFFRLTR